MTTDRVRIVDAVGSADFAAALAGGQSLPVGRPTAVRLVDMGDGTFAEAVTPARAAIRRVAIPLATNGSGACTAYSAAVDGLVVGFYLDVGSGGTALASGVDLTITEEDTGAPIVTLTNVGAASARYMPRVDVHDATGAATGALDAPPVVGRIKVVVAQGGDTRSGTLYAYVDGRVADA